MSDLARKAERSKQIAKLAIELEPFLVNRLARINSGTAVSAGGLVAHDLDSIYHTGTLSTGQAPWAVTTSTFSSHTADADAHHAQSHDVVSISDHTIAGAAFSVVGATATNTIGLLTPSNAPGAAESLLKSSSAGNLTLPTFTATTSVTTPAILSTGDLTITPAGGDVFVVGRMDLTGRLLGGIGAQSSGGTLDWNDTSNARSGSGFSLMRGSDSSNAPTGASTSAYYHPLNFEYSTKDGSGNITQLAIPYSTTTSLDSGIYMRGRLIGTWSNWVKIISENTAGNVLIGTNTDAGYKFNVTGTARVTTSLTTPLITTATNTDLVINPAGTGAVQFPNDQTLRTSTFDSSFPIGGWQINEVAGISGYSSLTIGKIQADELAVRVFVADEVRVDRGDEFWTKSYGIVATTFTSPGSVGATVSVKFEDSPALAGAIFTNNDWVLFRNLEIDTGIVLYNIWGQVTSYVNNSDGTQNWTFTLRSGATSKEVRKGSLAIDFGASGAALIHLSVIDSAGAPYIKMRKWVTNPYTPANFVTYVQLGNLGSTANSYVTPAGFGLYVRSTSDESRFLLADDNGLQIRGASLALYNGATQTVNLSYTGQDFWIGPSSADKRLYWNGTTLSVTGQIVVQSGSSGYANITDKPTTLSGINSTEGTKLAGIAANATVGATWGTNLNSVPTRFGDAPSTAGLYLTPTHMGYYDGSAWKAWIASTGQFYFGGSTGAHLEWNGSKLRGLGTDGTTEQWYAQSSDGKIYAGAGKVWLDSGGANFSIEAASTNPTYIKFVDSIGSSTVGSIGYFYINGTTPGANDGMIFWANSGHKFRFINSYLTEFQNAISVGTNITVGGTVDGVDIAAFKSAYDSHNHTSLYLALSGGTLTGTVTSRTIAPSANNTYEIGSSSNYFVNGYIRNLYTDTIVGTPSYSHTHAAADITSGTLADARLPTTMAGKTFSSGVIIDADTGTTSNYVRWLTQTSTGKAWDLTGRAHDYATTPSQQNDLLLTYYDGSTIYTAFQADSATRVIDFAQTPTVGGTAVSLSGHIHDDRYYTETELNAGQLNTLYYTETEVNSLLTGYVPTSRTVTAGSGMTGGGALSANITLSHADTSSQASVDNSGVNFIQGITLDTYGHITAIGTASISSALDATYVNVSGDTMTGQLVLPTAWTLDTQAITRGYSIAKGMNLVVNGSGLMGNNYNFGGFTFDPVETYSGGGSFKYTGAQATKTSTELISVSVGNYYRFVLWAKNGNIDGSNHDTGNKHYAGVICYDADKLFISPAYFMRYGSSALTTLAAQLNPGDTTVTLSDATGWGGSAGSAYQRQFIWYPYTNALGFTYPDYTYSRNSTNSTAHYVVNGAWAVGGISGNVITLTQAWSGPTLTAGTKVMNSTSGNIYKYTTLVNQTIPNSWTRYEGYIGGIDTNLDNATNEFPPGTAYVQLVILANYSPTVSTNVIRFSDIWFSEISSRNLEVTSATVPGVIALADQQLGTGVKWVPSRFGVGMSSAPTTYTLDVAGTARATGVIYAGSDIEMTGELLAANGTAGAPSVAALSDTNTGIYWSAADTLSVATGGTLRLSVSTAAVTSTLPVLLPDGTLGAPSLTFAADTDSGIYRSSSNTWYLVAGGVGSMAVLNTGVLVNGTLNTTGAAFLASDTDTAHNAGRVRLGYAVGTDTASFSHVDRTTSADYALSQSQVGATILNAASAQTVSLAIAGTPQWTVNSDRMLPRGDSLLDIGDYNRKVRVISVTELHAQTLVAEEVIATIGGDILVTPTTKLIADIAAATGAPGYSSLYTTMIAYWPLDESSGTRVDAKGANDLSALSAGYTASGKQGGAMVLSGTNSAGATDNSELSTGDVDWYFSCWIYPTNDNGNLQCIAAKGTPAGSRSWALRVAFQTDNRVYLDVWNAGQTQTTFVGASTFGALSINTWYFVECWHNATSNTIGVAVNRTENTTTFTYGTADDTGPFTLGQFDTSEGFIGRIDEAGLWKSAIPNSTDRNFLYNSGSGKTFTNIYQYGAAAINFDVEHNNLRNGEYVIMKSAPAGIPQFERFQMTSSATPITGGYRYTATRDNDGTGSNNWYIGDAAASEQKNAGEGFLWLTSTATEYSHTGPGMIGYVRTGTGASDIKPAFVTGNLRSFIDYASDEFGSAAGNDLTLTPTTGFKGYAIDRTNGLRLFNVDLSGYNSSNKTVSLSSTNGTLKLGTNVASGTTTGFTFDGSNGNITIGSASYASTVTIYGAINLLAGGNAAKVDFSNVTATLDSLGDGTTYKRVKAAALDANGLVVVDALVDGTYARVKASSLNASGLILIDQVVDGTYGKVLTADISAGHIRLDATVDGTYGKVLTTDISAGHIRLDSAVDGTYGKVLSTIISAGNIQVGSGTKDSTLSGWNISSTEIVGQTSGVDQVVLGTDGKVKAGAGAIVLDRLGLHVANSGTSNGIVMYRTDTFSDTYKAGRLWALSDLGSRVYLSAGRSTSDGDATNASGYLDLVAYNSGGTGGAAITLNGGGGIISLGGTLGEAWNNLSFGSGWTNYGGSYLIGQYKKVGDLILLRGLVKRTSGSGTTIATLPAGYRPSAQLLFGIYTDTGVGRIDISTGGNFDLMAGGVGFVQLDGIIFSTA